jgi:hypothetical protein
MAPLQYKELHTCVRSLLVSEVLLISEVIANQLMGAAAAGPNAVRMMPDRLGLDRLGLDRLGQATPINKPTFPCM